MKNNNDNEIKLARAHKQHKAVTTDILVNVNVIQHNQQRLAVPPKRRRRIDYTKKIMNDPFIMNV